MPINIAPRSPAFVDHNGAAVPTPTTLVVERSSTVLGGTSYRVVDANGGGNAFNPADVGIAPDQLAALHAAGTRFERQGTGDYLATGAGARGLPVDTFER